VTRRIGILALSLLAMLASGAFVAFDHAVTRSWSVPTPLVDETAVQPKILGHRGAVLPGIVENTWAAFEYALENGADGVETDLQTSSDGYVVLFHDHLLENRPISSYSYKNLAKMGVQRWLPVLKWAKTHNLEASWELKGTWTDREVAHACGMVLAEGMDETSTMITHQRTTLAQLGRICPQLRTGFISLKALIPPEQARNLAPVYMPSVARLRQEDATSYRAAGLDLHVWTIRTRDQYLKAVAAGASAVICDDVRLCRALSWVER
jgi:glycerophosphoryl diester phosphodiesterase